MALFLFIFQYFIYYAIKLMHRNNSFACYWRHEGPLRALGCRTPMGQEFGWKYS